MYDYEHLNCAQAQYQSSRRGFKKTGTWPLDKDVRKHTYRQKVYRDTYSIPLKNRFSKLSQEDQGNFWFGLVRKVPFSASVLAQPTKTKAV